MNKFVIAGACLLSFSAVLGSSVVANAQSSNPDATLSKVFGTDNSLNSFGAQAIVNSAGIGVGYGSNTTWFPATNGGNNPANAQTVYTAFTYKGTGDVAAGSSFQIGVHGYAQGTNPTVFASIYALSGSLSQNSLPSLGTAVVSNAAIVFGTSSGDKIYYSAKTTTSSTLVNGQNYVLVFSPTGPGQNTPTNFAVVDRRTYSTSGQTGTQSINDNSWTTLASAPGTVDQYRGQFVGTTGNLGYRLYAGAPVPEPSAFLGLGAFASLLGLGVKLRRRA